MYTFKALKDIVLPSLHTLCVLIATCSRSAPWWNSSSEKNVWHSSKCDHKGLLVVFWGHTSPQLHQWNPPLPQKFCLPSVTHNHHTACEMSWIRTKNYLGILWMLMVLGDIISSWGVYNSWRYLTRQTLHFVHRSTLTWHRLSPVVHSRTHLGQ